MNDSELSDEDISNYNFIMEIAFGEENLLEKNPPPTLHVLTSLLYDIRKGNISFKDDNNKFEILILMASYIKHAKDIKVIKRNNETEVMH